MKKLIACALAALMMSSCAGYDMSETDHLFYLSKKYPNCDIYKGERDREYVLFCYDAENKEKSKMSTGNWKLVHLSLMGKIYSRKELESRKYMEQSVNEFPLTCGNIMVQKDRDHKDRVFCEGGTYAGRH